MNAPNVVNIRKWVDALRSGEYAQTRGRLARVDDNGNLVGHCCLGVACEVAGVPRTIDSPYKYLPDYRVTYNGADASLPPSVVQWLGLRDHNPLMQRGGGVVRAIAAINDDGASFDEIADLIEAEWLTEATA